MGAAERGGVVVTGASSGIGLGTVRVLVKRGFRVFGGVRTEKDAERLRTDFGPSVLPVIMDITDQASVSEAAKQVRRALKGHTLQGLVNNAGVMSPLAPLMLQSLAEFQVVMDTNVTGTLRVTQAFLPLLIGGPSWVGPPGRIVMISSVSGVSAAPYIGAYNASKHALEALAGSLRLELMLYGVDVIVIGPGAVKTHIWNKIDLCNIVKYKGTVFEASLAKFGVLMKARGTTGHASERIGRGVLMALTVKHPYARYAIIYQRLMNWTLTRIMPVRWLDKILGRMFGLCS